MKTMLELVDSILAKMQSELLKSSISASPNDLEFIRDQLMATAYPGASFAWTAGPVTNNLVILGREKDEQGLTQAFLNVSSKDVFYQLEITLSSAGFTLKKISREQFSSLASLPVPFKSNVSGQDSPSGELVFWLLKNGVRVGYISTEFVGRNASGHAVYQHSITPTLDASYFDKTALLRWATRAAEVNCGSLWAAGEIVWHPAVRQRSAA